MKRVLTIITIFGLCVSMSAQSVNAAYQAYIEQYRDIAVEQERKHGIPASITLAQALLESGAGQSELATKANNHFGIKCTSDWSGKTYKLSKSKACFRKYADPEGSYEDHSKFLQRKHYERLFTYSVKDYKKWARGLRECGYATDPKYPDKLIQIIELYELDKLTTNTKASKKSKKSRTTTKSKTTTTTTTAPTTTTTQAKESKSPKATKRAKNKGSKTKAVQPPLVNASYQAYVEQYRYLAIEQQRKYNIPASITMAQAILESAAGQSVLAKEANNHFGIKCTSDWKGKTYKYAKDGACYRKYAEIADSYEDHSLFLKRSRYESLFALSIADYKNWAHGLKACGYATDPKYADKLIRIVELYELNKLTFDRSLVKSGAVNEDNLQLNDDTTEIDFVAQETVEDYPMPPMEELELFHNHRSGRRNGVRYIIASGNETFASLALFLNMYERTLRKYNDALDERELVAGDIVYIYPKKNRAERRYPSYYFREGDTAWSIAQKYGIKLKSLYKLNGIPYGTPLTTHQRLDLR